MLLRAFLLLAPTLLATPAFADAVTYRGMVGDAPVVIELSSDIAAPLPGTVGRFFYLDRGVDTPLHAVSSIPGQIDLIEELPCSPTACPGRDGPQYWPATPLGPTWTLQLNDGGTGISGTRQVAGTRQPIALSRIGTRPVDLSIVRPPQPLDLLGAVNFDLAGTPLALQTSPYDYLRMNSATRKGAVAWWQDMAWRMLADSRTGLAMPRLVSTGGGDIGPANAWLEQRHWLLNDEAYYCAAKDFLEFGWSEEEDFVTGSFGGYQDEYVEVTMMTPVMLSWFEQGSTGCSNAPPWNHYRVFNLDIETGRPFDLSLIFKGWLPTFGGTTLEMGRADPLRYQWGPDKELADFVLAHRVPHPYGDLETQCDFDSLVRNYLAIGFRQGGYVYFTLDRLPNVMQGCRYELFTTSIEELRPLLAETAGDYFFGLGSMPP